jgi:hypothetical protein
MIWLRCTSRLFMGYGNLVFKLKKEFAKTSFILYNSFINLRKEIEMKVLHILIDDIRNLQGMDIIIRDPQAAYTFLDAFDTSGHFLYMDNDLGDHDLLNEGQSILRYAITLGQLPKKVILVTSNSVAANNMRNLLVAHGYTENPNRVEYDLK